MELLTAVLHSAWLVPVLVLMIAVDGPLPVLPTETLLFTALAGASVHGNTGMVAALFTAAVSGNLIGDLATHSLGRGSHRLLNRSACEDSGVARWIRSNLHRRPVTALVAARFLPGGRLLGSVAAGRLGLGRGRFVAGSAVASLLWGIYILVVGLALVPVTGDNPLLGLLAGAAIAVTTTAAFGLARRIPFVRERMRSGAPEFVARRQAPARG